MSSNGQYERNPAKFILSGEFNDATIQFQESDSETASRWTLFPTGLRANRVCIAGTVTATTTYEAEEENKADVHRARVNDGTSGGNFFVYAHSEYNQTASRFIQALEPPTIVGVVGKIRMAKPDDKILVNVAPEEMNEIPKNDRDWIIHQGAKKTLERIEAFEEGSSADIDNAIEEYGSDHSKYRSNALTALEGLL